MRIATRTVATAAGRSRVVVRSMVTFLTFAAAGVVAAVAGAATPLFSAPVLVKTGPGAETLFSEDLNVLAGDVNGDGNPDVVAATSGAVTVLFGNGDGSFRRQAFRVRAPVDVAVGDVSGDGQPDLIAVRSNYEDGFVVVFVNDGAGSFRRDGVYTLKNDEATRVATGDLNGDGISDVVVGGLQGEFSILLASGDGRLAAPRTVPGSGGRDLTVGDFNADGKLDVALAALSTRSVTVRLGNGDGSFGPARAFGVARDDAMTVSTADLNNDAKVDLVITREPGQIGVLLGNNDGTFGAQTTYPMGSAGYPTGTALVGDLNGDHIADIAAAGSWPNFTPVRPGVGDGTFRRRRLSRPFSTFTSVVEEYSGTGAVADFNRDGRLDLAVVARGSIPDGTEPEAWPEPGWLAVLLNRTGLRNAPCVVVPVTHELLHVARRHLRNAGCRVGHVVYRYSRKTRRHRVISQRQSYGSVLTSQSPVRLVVSRGRRR